jgi:hypothetical protein
LLTLLSLPFSGEALAGDAAGSAPQSKHRVQQLTEAELWKGYAV